MQVFGPISLELELLSMLALAVSVGGFGIAFWQIKRTRNAAEHAEEAAVAARETVLRRMSISDLNQAHAIIEELKRLHRSQDFSQAINRYTPLRQLLTDVQAKLPVEAGELFNEAIDALMEMEVDIDNAISSDSFSDLDTSDFYSMLVELQQELHKMRLALEQNPSEYLG